MTNYIEDIINEVNMSDDPSSIVTFIKGTVKPEWHETLKKEYPYESQAHVMRVEDYMNGTDGIYVVTLTKEPQHKHESDTSKKINILFWMVSTIVATGIAYLAINMI